MAALPKQAAASGQQPPPTNAAFADPVFAQLSADAQRDSPTLAEAWAAWQRARSLAQVQAARLGPVLDASASAQRQRSELAGQTDARSTFQAALGLQWTPDVFGAQQAARAAAQFDASALWAEFDGATRSVDSELALALVQWRELHARLGLAESTLTSQIDTLQITQWREQAGLLSQLEVAQAQAEAGQTRAQLPLLRTSLDQAQHRLELLTRRPPGALDPAFLAQGSERPQAQLDTAATADSVSPPTPVETLSRRADVRAARARVQAAWARWVQATAQRYPTFSISGSLGLSALSLSALGNASSVVASLLGSVGAVLWDGGALRAQAQAQEAALHGLAAAHDATVLAALADVEDQWVALTQSRLRLAHLQQASGSAVQAQTLADARFRSGLTTYAVLLQTQRTALQAQDSLATAQSQVAATQVRLKLALGATPLPEPDIDPSHRWSLP